MDQTSSRTLGNYKADGSVRDFNYMGLRGFTTQFNYQLDAYMPEHLETVVDELIEAFRAWDNINAVQKISYGWASAIYARNSFIRLAMETIMEKLTWLDGLLSLFPI